MADTKNLSKQKNYIYAYEYLKNKIINGEYEEGYVFLETEISEELGISRTPVREALCMLKIEGLLFNVPRKGIVCRRLTFDDISDVYELAEGVEGMMAYLVAKEGKKSTIDALEGAVVQMEEALLCHDEESWVEADERFHCILKEECGNGFIEDSMNNLWLYIRMIRSKYTKTHIVSMNRSTGQHREAYEAIAAGDADYARTLVQNHWKTVRQQFL